MSAVRPMKVPKLGPGDHVCGIYRTAGEHRSLVVELVRNAVERGDRVFYVLDMTSFRELQRVLEDAGLDAAQLVDRRQLVVVTAKETYLRDGVFDPERMFELVRAETEHALRDGHRALAVTGEMTWALAGEPGTERLMEYESQLNQRAPAGTYAVCQYDRRRFDAELLIDVLRDHPKVLLGAAALDNSRLYFVPVGGALRHRQNATLDRYLANLADRELPA